MNPLSFRVWLACAIMLAPLASTQAFGGAENLFVNPGFEDNGGSYDGWTTFGNGVQLSTPATDNIIRTGGAASKTFGEFTDCPTEVFDVGGFFQAVTPTPGVDYVFSGYTFVSDADPMLGTDECLANRLIAKLVFFDAAVGGNEIQTNELIIGNFDTPTEQWNRFQLSAPSPAGALRVEALFLFLQPGCDEGAVFIDDTSLCEVTPPVQANLLVNPSFDVDLFGWDGFGNVFYDGRSFARRTTTGAAKLFSTFVQDEPSGLFQSFPAAPGSDWLFEVYSMSTCVEDPINGTNDNVGLARVAFFDGTGTEVGGAETVIIDNTSPLGTWTKHSVIGYNAPAGTETVQAFILFTSPTLMGGAMFVDDALLQELDVIAVDDQPVTTPTIATLGQNAPNPFNPSTRIGFELVRSGNVDVSIYDVAGRQVATLFSGTLEAGQHELSWDGRTSSGEAAAAGVYRYVLETSEGRVSRSMVLAK